jgi:GDP-L-fucose synthase
VEAQERGDSFIDVWGTGSASREYLYVEDAAAAIVLAAENHEGVDPINLGSDREITIRETAETIARVTGFSGELKWDATKPDGQPRRRIDPSRAARTLGWTAQMDFAEGIRRTVEWYRTNRDIAEATPR